MVSSNRLPGATAYMQAARIVLDEVFQTQLEAIDQAADEVTRAIKAGGLIYLFGTGHSHILAEEGHHRAGGLAPICPILVSSLMVHGSSRVSSQLERVPGVGRAILARYPLAAEDVLIVFSNSGVNAAPVEVAMVAKETGMTVVAVVSMRYAAQAAPGPLGRKLVDVADIVIDNRAIPGDALVEIPGTGGLRAGPISTVVGAYVLNAILTEAAWRLAEGGVEPPIYVSANMPGAAEHNLILRNRYRSRIPHM